MKEDRILHLYGLINSDTVAPILESIVQINNVDNFNANDIHYKREPIHMFINSGGGIMYDANTLLSAMDSSKTPIYTYCHGYAMSAGLTIFVAGHKRYAGQHATFMLHQPKENIGEDKYFVMENRIEETKRLMNNRIKYVASRTKVIDLDFEMKKHVDWFMDVNQAIDYGIVHEII